MNEGTSYRKPRSQTRAAAARSECDSRGFSRDTRTRVTHEPSSHSSAVVHTRFPNGPVISSEMQKQSVSSKRALGDLTSRSKYDFVKVRVWLSEDAEAADAPVHHYVLSRFLVSRVLTVTQMRYHDAIRLALELKKRLVDQQRLDVPQHEMEASLFELMAANGYGGEYIRRFRMMSSFHRQRLPLVILIAGTGCIGKSTLATQLAERLNIPNVLQTDLVRMLSWLSSSASEATAAGDVGSLVGAAGSSVALSGLSRLWTRHYESAEALLAAHRTEVAEVCDAILPDLTKALADGKPLIVEGSHVQLHLFEEALSTLPHGMTAVTVPFVLSLDAAAHAELLQYWLACQPSAVLGVGEEGSVGSVGSRGASGLQSITGALHDTMLSQLARVQEELEVSASRCKRLRPRHVAVQVHAVEHTLDALHSAVLESVEKQFYNGEPVAALDLEDGGEDGEAPPAEESSGGGREDLSCAAVDAPQRSRFIVRPATPMDVLGVAALWHAAYPDQQGVAELPVSFLAERTLSEFERRARDRVASTLVGCELSSGELMGMAVACTHADGRPAELEQLFVLPQARGPAGLGAQLLRAAEQRLAAAGCALAAGAPVIAELFVFQQNARARCFYERHGWRCTGVQPHAVEISNGRTFTLQLARYEKQLEAVYSV